MEHFIQIERKIINSRPVAYRPSGRIGWVYQHSAGFLRKAYPILFWVTLGFLVFESGIQKRQIAWQDRPQSVSHMP